MELMGHSITYVHKTYGLLTRYLPSPILIGGAAFDGLSRKMITVEFLAADRKAFML